MKKILVMLADGVEEIEALTVVDVLRRAEIEVVMTSITKSLTITGAHNISFQADALIDNIVPSLFDGIILPGGMPGTLALDTSSEVASIVTSFNKEKKLVAAICAAPMVLGHLGILEGKNATCYPGMEEHLIAANPLEDIVVIDDNIITSRGPATAMPFALALVNYLLGYNESQAIEEAVLY